MNNSQGLSALKRKEKKQKRKQGERNNDPRTLALHGCRISLILIDNPHAGKLCELRSSLTYFPERRLPFTAALIRLLAAGAGRSKL